MTTRISEVIHQWLGWCPNAQARVRNAEVRPDNEAVVPSEGGSFKARAFHWLGLFRNQMLLLSIWFSIVGFLLLITIGNANLTMFSYGLLAGALLSVFQGFRLWKTMNEVLESGAIFLTSLYDKTTVLIIILAFMLPTILLFGASPAMNLTMWNAGVAGFICTLFWVNFLVVWLWERKTDRHMQSDGLMLSVARGD